jgi:hypothetical protein
MGEANLRLSHSEEEVFRNATFILTKNAVIEKVISFFSVLQLDYSEIAEKYEDCADYASTSPKISRGENYLGLPYVVLDYPKLFGHEDVLAVRSMCWWGNFFSITLHLSGVYQRKYAGRLYDNHEFLSHCGYYLCINEDPWQHHFERSNYRVLSDVPNAEFRKHLYESPFVKIAYPLFIADGVAEGEQLRQKFGEIMKLLSSQDGEITP